MKKDYTRWASTCKVTGAIIFEHIYRFVRAGGAENRIAVVSTNPVHGELGVGLDHVYTCYAHPDRARLFNLNPELYQVGGLYIPGV